jgi:ADP-glucose pyrophosphorylase
MSMRLCSENNVGSDYYRANMALLNRNVRDELFRRSSGTPKRESSLHILCRAAEIYDSLVADGCLLRAGMKGVSFFPAEVGKGPPENCLIMHDGELRSFRICAA